MASFVLGGGTDGGFLSDAILQLIATPRLLLALWQLIRNPAVTHLRGALAFCAAFVLVPVLQLIPLPPALWTRLPGHEVIAETFTLADQELPCWPISVAPQETWLGLISPVVPLGIFLGTMQLRRRERRLISLAVLTVGTGRRAEPRTRPERSAVTLTQATAPLIQPGRTGRAIRAGLTWSGRRRSTAKRYGHPRS